MEFKEYGKHEVIAKRFVFFTSLTKCRHDGKLDKD